MAEANILYLGHSTAVITEGDTRIIVDPWLDGNPRCPAEYHSFSEVDIVCLTHGHSDHTGSAVEVATKSNAKVFANYELAMLLMKDGVEGANVQPMNTGGTVEYQNVRISLVPAFHSSSYEDRKGVTHYAGQAAGAIIELPSGKTIYHAGDTALFSDMELIGREYEPDVALLPIGDRFTMGPEEAATAARLVGAPLVIPIHYKTFDLLSGTVASFREALAGSEIEVAAPEPGEEVSF